MTHDQLVALLERERISYPDQLEAERYAPEPPVRPTDPVSSTQADRNRQVLARIVKGLEND